MKAQSAQPRVLVITDAGGVPLVAPPHEVQSPALRRAIAKASALADPRAKSKALGEIERSLGVTVEERIAAGHPAEGWEADFDAALPGAVAGAWAATKPVRKIKGGRKAGRRSSGLRGLSPEGAAAVVAGWSLDAVREVEEMRKRAGDPSAYAGAVTLERLLAGDYRAEVVVEDESIGVNARMVLRQRDPTASVLRAAGVDESFASTARAFLNDLEAVRAGKLTAGYAGRVSSGATSGEPERMVVALDSLRRGQAKLTGKQRVAVWAFLVHGLPLRDIGWAVSGDKFGDRQEKLEAAATLFIEGALAAMEPAYRKRSERA